MPKQDQGKKPAKKMDKETVRKKWADLAKERNARVILCHAPDTYMLTDLTRAADRAMRMLRDQMFTQTNLETTQELFSDYNNSILSLYAAVSKINKMLDIRYKPSLSLVKWLETQGINVNNDAKEASDQAAAGVVQ